MFMDSMATYPWNTQMDLGNTQRTDTVPPETHCLVADINTTSTTQIFDISRESGNQTYITTAKQMISGLFREYQRGLGFVIRQSYAPPHCLPQARSL